MTAARDESQGLDDLTPGALLDALADADHARRIADRNILRIVHQWAVLHPATTETGTATWAGASFLLTDESLGGDGTPAVAAYTAEPLAVTLHISPASAQQLLADTLDLHHRLPHTWARVENLSLPAWKARRLATATHALPRDVAAEIDRALAPRLHRIGPTAIDNALAHATANAQPDEQREREQQAQSGWDVTLHTPQTLDFAGTSELVVIGDTPRLTRLYRQLSRHAAAAGRADDDQRPLGARKVEAFTDLLSRGLQTVASATSSTTGAASVVEEVAQRPSRDPRTPATAPGETVLYLHADLTDLMDDTVTIGRAERLGPATTDLIHQWLGNSSLVRIQPVLRTDSDDTIDGHDPPDRIREQVILRDRTCIFPGCTTDARRCDLDHTDPYQPTGPPGQTRPTNLAALCRRHHRAKTAGLWRYRHLPTTQGGGYEWTGPLGIRLTVRREATARPRSTTI